VSKIDSPVLENTLDWCDPEGRSLSLKVSILKTTILLTVAALLVCLTPAFAKDVLVGVNVMTPADLSEDEQDRLVDDLCKAHVKIIRVGTNRQGMGLKPLFRFISKSHERGIGAIITVAPGQGGTGEHTAPADPKNGRPWATGALSDANPAGFRKWMTTQMQALDAAGIRAAAFELGNEVNSVGFNGDFIPPYKGRVLGISDLSNPNDKQGQAVAKGYQAYVRIMEVLKDVRDHSTVNKSTPIITSGLANCGMPGDHGFLNLDWVSIPGSIEYWRQLGIDRLVDGYGVHVYPPGNAQASVADRVSELKRSVFAGGGSKPFWLTEWNFNSKVGDKASDKEAMGMAKVERAAFSEFSKKHNLAAVIWYSWAGMPHKALGSDSIFRNGALTDTGKEALKPL
jgi:hypothetical protein